MTHHHPVVTLDQHKKNEMCHQYVRKTASEEITQRSKYETKQQRDDN